MWKKIKYVNDENEGRIKHSKVVVKIKKKLNICVFLCLFLLVVSKMAIKETVFILCLILLPLMIEAEDKTGNEY